MAKQLLYTDEARKKLLLGGREAPRPSAHLGPTAQCHHRKIASAARLSPRWRHRLKEIDSPDPFENMGANW